MPLFTELIASGGFVMGLSGLGAVCAVGVCVMAWSRTRLLSMTAVAVLVGMLCAYAEPAEKPIPKALPVADDEPITRTKRNEDPNAFLPFTRISQTKGNVAERGGKTSVGEAETPLGRYYRLVIKEVEKKWHIYLRLRREGVTAGELKLIFYIAKKGKVEDLRVLDDKKSNKVLTEFTLQAIRDAEIPPMPADVIPLLPKEDQERLKIQYDVLIY